MQPDFDKTKTISRRDIKDVFALLISVLDLDLMGKHQVRFSKDHIMAEIDKARLELLKRGATPEPAFLASPAASKGPSLPAGFVPLGQRPERGQDPSQEAGAALDTRPHRDR